MMVFLGLPEGVSILDTPCHHHLLSSLQPWLALYIPAPPQRSLDKPRFAVLLDGTNCPELWAVEKICKSVMFDLLPVSPVRAIIKQEGRWML